MISVLNLVAGTAQTIATQFAAGGTDPLTTGAINVLNYVSTTILVLVPLVGGVMVGITALKKMQSTDESEVAMLNKRMKTIITYAAVAEVSMALIKWLLTMF